MSQSSMSPGFLFSNGQMVLIFAEEAESQSSMSPGFLFRRIRYMINFQVSKVAIQYESWLSFQED